MKRILKLAGVGILAVTAGMAQSPYYGRYAPENYARPQAQTYNNERYSYQYGPAYPEPQVRDRGWDRGGDSYDRNDRYRDNDRYYEKDRGRDRDRYRDDGYRVERERPFDHSAAIVGGGAALGALAGGIAGHGKGAAIGALSGGLAGFIYDRVTHNHAGRF